MTDDPLRLPPVLRGVRAAELIRQARLAEEAGFDEVYIGQAGGEHDGFFEFYANTVLPRLREG